ncbi:MAG: RNA 2',3'-cyclic phosphodiesterase [Pyrinomonadaceae bacterium]
MNKRLFIALEIPKPAQKQLAEYTKKLKREFSDLKVGWEKEEKLHINLKFLGDVNENKISELIDLIGGLSQRFSGFNLRVEGTGVFPNKKRGRVLWLGIFDEGNDLLKINNELEGKCQKIGFVREKKPFRPHVTIARIRKPFSNSPLVKKHLKNEYEPVEFSAQTISLIESRLLPTGSVYYPFFREDLSR